MKRIILAAVAATAVALSFSPALAHDTSPGERVIRGDELYITQPAPAASDARFLSGSVGSYDQTLGVSDNGIQGREFRAVQHNSHWLQNGDDY